MNINGKTRTKLGTALQLGESAFLETYEVLVWISFIPPIFENFLIENGSGKPRFLHKCPKNFPSLIARGSWLYHFQYSPAEDLRNCEWNQWTAWGECSHQHGAGQAKRTRSFVAATGDGEVEKGTERFRGRRCVPPKIRWTECFFQRFLRFVLE